MASCKSHGFFSFDETALEQSHLRPLIRPTQLSQSSRAVLVSYSRRSWWQDFFLPPPLPSSAFLWALTWPQLKAIHPRNNSDSSQDPLIRFLESLRGLYRDLSRPMIHHTEPKLASLKRELGGLGKFLFQPPPHFSNASANFLKACIHTLLHTSWNTIRPNLRGGK